MLKGGARHVFASAILAFCLRAEPSSPAAIDETPKGCEVKQTTYSSYNDGPAPIIFGVTELWRTIDCYRDDISATSTLFIAVFTIVLGVFTISLARSTRRAATIAERALTELERPWVVLEGAHITRRELSHEGIKPNHWFAQLRFKNLGRSPAAIEMCPFGIAPKDSLPPNPVYSTNSYLTSQRHVGSGESFETNAVGPSDDGREVILVFYGKLFYRELNGRTHETGFAIEVSPHIAAFSPYIGDAYTYHT
jgi:hypothetical protein